MTLTEFVLARIAEDEGKAREAITERERVHGSEYTPDTELLPWPDLGVPAMLIGPERVLAECEAKRTVVALCGSPDPHTPDEAGNGECNECAVLYTLALPYADHPDYDPAWRP